MRYSYHDIRRFFKLAGYDMRPPRDGFNYLESVAVNGVNFVLESDEAGVSFYWQTTGGQSLLYDCLPAIQSRRPSAHSIAGSKNEAWTRLIIPLDQERPLCDALDAVEQTKALVSYSA